MYELDTSKLPPGTLVLNVFMLCSYLGIKHDYNDEAKDEYLFYRAIPGACIGKSWDPRTWGSPEIEGGYTNKRELISLRCRGRSDRPLVQGTRSR